MAVDPVCEMVINENEAEKEGNVVELEGKKYYFCATGCKDRFTEDPEKYKDKYE